MRVVNKELIWLFAAAVVLVAARPSSELPDRAGEADEMTGKRDLKKRSPVAAPAPAPIKSTPVTVPVAAPTIRSPVAAPAPAPIKSTPVTVPVAAPTIRSPVAAPAPAPINSPPVKVPVAAPTIGTPVAAPAPALTAQVTTFYAIGDVPYTSSDATILTQQIKALKMDADFLIHVGDIRRNNGKACVAAEYSAVADILSLSPIPVFVIVGDNEYTDCVQGRAAALKLWKAEFMGFESLHWNHPFDITRQPNYEENFSFVYRETLFIGLNIPGGTFASFWTVHLSDQLQWTKDLINEFVSNLLPRKGRIVLFAHAKPNSDHIRLFFGPLATFIDATLNNETPFLYLHGDGHYWLYNPGYRGQESLLQIMVKGGVSEPPVKFFVRANGQSTPTDIAFQYDRQL